MINSFFSVALAAAAFANPMPVPQQTISEGIPFPSIERPARPENQTRSVKKAGSSSFKETAQRVTPPGKVLTGYQYTRTYGIPYGLWRIQEWCDMEFMSVDDYSRKGYYLNQGWIRDGRLCAVADYSIFTIIDYRYLEMDPFTGEILEDRVININDPVTSFPNYLPVYISAAYDPDNDKLYGYTSSENGLGYAFFNAPGNAPEKSVSVKTPIYNEVCVSLAFNTDDGYLYGINRDNDFVRITSRGEQTVIFSTGLRTQYMLAGMVYVPENKTFLWEMILSDNTYALAEIDPEAKTITTLGNFDDVEEFAFFNLLDATKDPNPIKAPGLDEMKFNHADRSGTISYFTPTELFVGGKINGEIEWHATLDGAEYLTGTVNAGDIVEVNYTGLETGNHTFGFNVRQGDRGSSTNTQSMFVGYDVPQAPTDVTLSDNRIEWTGVSRCVNDGYLDQRNLIYHVYVNDVEVGKTSDTFLDHALPTDAPYTCYTAKVVADNNGFLSAETSSESIRFGKPWELDAFIEPTAADAAVSSAFDINGDKNVWTYYVSSSDNIGYFSAPHALGQTDSDDWLFLPPMNFDSADVAYEITYEVGNFSDWYPNQFLALYLCNDLDPRAVETEIQENRTFTNTKVFNTYSQKFAVSNPGTYYIALYCNNTLYQHGLRVRNIHVKQLTTGTELPGQVTDLKAVGAPLGELKAIVDFNLPTKYISESLIPDSQEIKATVTCAGNTVDVTGKPGEHITIEIPSEQSINKLSVVSSIDGIRSKDVTIDVFTGIDVPSQMASIEGYMSEDNLQMTLKWTKPATTVGENGYYFNPDDVDYYVLIPGDEGWEVYEELGKNVFEYTYSVEPGSPLATVNVGIVPGTVEGRCSTFGYMSDAMGTPWTLPIREEFENAKFQYGPIRIIRLNENYANAEWGVVNPRLIDPSMANDSEMAAYGRSEGPGKYGMLMLPKVDLENIVDPGIVFNFWTGTGAASVTIYGEVYDHDGFIEIGKVPSYTQGWQELHFPFPDAMKDHKWAAIYIDAYFQNANRYAMFSNYEVRGGVTGILDVAAEDGWIRSGRGEIVVEGFAGKPVNVFSLDGREIFSDVADSDELHISAAAGTYIVRAGDSSVKIIVR